MRRSKGDNRDWGVSVRTPDDNGSALQRGVAAWYGEEGGLAQTSSFEVCEFAKRGSAILSARVYNLTAKSCRPADSLREIADSPQQESAPAGLIEEYAPQAKMSPLGSNDLGIPEV